VAAVKFDIQPGYIYIASPPYWYRNPL